MRYTDILSRVHTPEEWNNMVRDEGENAVIKHAVLIMLLYDQIVENRAMKKRMVWRCIAGILTILLTL